MKTRFAIFILLLFFVYTFSFAQNTLVSIDQSVEIAIKNNYDIRIARIREDEAVKRVSSAWGAVLPVIESNATATRQSAESGFMSLSNGSYDIRVVQASLSVNPGIFYNALRAASYENAFAREESRRIKHQVESDTINAFFGIIRARELVQMREDSARYLAANLKDVANLVKSGNSARFELLQAEVQSKNAVALQAEARTALHSAEDYFNLILGATDTKYTAQSDSNYEPGEIVSDDPKIEETLVQIALKNRPEIIQLETRGKQSESIASSQRSIYLWPTFFTQANWGYSKNILADNSEPLPQDPAQRAIAQMMRDSFSKISGDESWQKSWQVRAGATFRWSSLLPVDSTHAKSDEEFLRSEEIQLAVNQLKNATAVSIRRIYLTLRTSYDVMHIRKDAHASAEEGLRIARESYRAGLIKNTDLLAAESTLSAARAGQIDAVNSFYTSLSDLRRETGSEIDTIIFTEKLK